MVKIRVARCFVWGWDSSTMALHSQDLTEIIQYANRALNYGLSAEDIADDVLGAYRHLFEDVDAEVDADELHVVCLPHGLTPSVMQPGAISRINADSTT